MGQKRPRRFAFASRPGGFAAFARTLAVLALAVQCLVVQTHVHAFAAQQAIQGAAITQSVVVATRDHTAAGHSATGACFICQAAATTRTGLDAPTAALPLIERAAAPIALQTVAQRAPRVPAHAWQSRAPPIQA